MGDLLAIIGGAIVITAVFLFGAVYDSGLRNDHCKKGDPVVIEAKVYRCVEQK